VQQAEGPATGGLSWPLRATRHAVSRDMPVLGIVRTAAGRSADE